ncbi:MAG: amino acid ABC transporter permease [Clostridiales bacterium]|nr:amino acid ABC transporter permease [Clostridiales bacterium]
MRPFHPQFILTALSQILPYIWVTLATMAATVFFGGLVGLLLARAKIRRGKIASALAQVYIYITRCVPSIVMLFIVYYGLPEFLLTFGIDINGFPVAFFVIVTFSILFASNMAEVFRSAYEAVDPGQREAALSAGLSEWQAFYRIILPQCTVYALPNFANSLVNLMKEGSLSYTIGMIDVMGKGQLVIGLNHGSYSLETYLALAVIYWCMTIIIERSFHGLEVHLFKSRRLTEAA